MRDLSERNSRTSWKSGWKMGQSVPGRGNSLFKGLEVRDLLGLDERETDRNRRGEV